MQVDGPFSNRSRQTIDNKNDDNEHDDNEYDDTDHDDGLFVQMLEFEKSLEKLELLQNENNMDYTKLDNSRGCNLRAEAGLYSDKSAGEIKLASLEGELINTFILVEQ